MIRKIINSIKEFFTIHCPKCGGELKDIYEDPHFHYKIYKCKDCKEEWHFP